MADFFAELKRRHIYRVGAAYVVVAWALTQLVEILTQVYTLPLWIAQAAIALLAIGFPVALLVTWTIESKPYQAVAAAVRSKPTIVDWTLCGALALVLIFMGYQQIAPSSEATRQAGVDAAKEAAASQTAVSLAVLPFSNLSSDPEQEFFSDGMTEEITSALARIPDLRVVARTSAYQFRSQNRDIQTIGQQLNATHFIEGSVRKAGTRVRITAQLIEAKSGVHVWAQNFDRELADVFAVQEEIATSIAGALNMQLGLAPSQQLISHRDIDPASYEQYLGARAVIRSRVNQGDAAARRVAAIAVLEQVVARHPQFAPAWATLSLGYFRTGIVIPGNPTVAEKRRSVDEWLPKAEAAARRANELDPNLADGYSQLAVSIVNKGELIRAEELYLKALALDQFHPETMHFYAVLLGAVGRLKESIAMREKLMTLDPLIGVYNSNYEEMLWADGQSETLLARPEISQTAPAFRARIYWSQRRYSEAADAVLMIPPQSDPEGTAKTAERLLRNGPGALASAESLPRFDNSLDGLDFVYLHVGAPELVIRAYEDSNAAGIPQLAAIVFLWHASYAPVRKTERFKALARAINLDDYWRTKGWPEFCRPIGADDFTCN